MKKIIFISILLSVLGFSLFADDLSSENRQSLVGKWVNQLGSTLTIESVDASGMLKGNYRSPSGSNNESYPAIGWVNYLAPVSKQSNVLVVSFSVRWSNNTDKTNYGSVTTWNGYLPINDATSKQLVIVGQWLLVRSNSGYIWDHILTGQDTFIKK